MFLDRWEVQPLAVRLTLLIAYLQLTAMKCRVFFYLHLSIDSAIVCIDELFSIRFVLLIRESPQSATRCVKGFSFFIFTFMVFYSMNTNFRGKGKGIKRGSLSFPYTSYIFSLKRQNTKTKAKTTQLFLRKRFVLRTHKHHIISAYACAYARGHVAYAFSFFIFLDRVYYG